MPVFSRSFTSASEGHRNRAARRSNKLIDCRGLYGEHPFQHIPTPNCSFMVFSRPARAVFTSCGDSTLGTTRYPCSLKKAVQLQINRAKMSEVCYNEPTKSHQPTSPHQSGLRTELVQNWAPPFSFPALEYGETIRGDSALANVEQQRQHIRCNELVVLRAEERRKPMLRQVLQHISILPERFLCVLLRATGNKRGQSISGCTRKRSELLEKAFS